MEPVRGERADCAKHAQYEDGEKDSLICLPVLIGKLLQVVQAGYVSRLKGSFPIV
jgi:hypothetical protein